MFRNERRKREGEILLDDNKKIYISCNSRGEYEFLFENKKLCKERIIYLNTSAWSTSEYGTAFGQTRNINILSASNPYYDYGMSGYPYLISGMDLAANLNINAHRPSGSSYNYIVEALIFRN